MKVLEHFSIPYQGLKNGMHTFWFEVENVFFEAFEESFIKQGGFKVKLDLDKRPDMAIAIFECDGYVVLPCDRCLLDFEMPLSLEFKLHIKYGAPDPNEDEVMFIDLETSKINFAQYIYEWICISLPMVRMHSDIKNCDPLMIEKLSNNSIENEDDNIFSKLKNIKFDN
ncbi:MAG: hypothetical protein RLZZ546_438 [Bacteroidota bacterium]|jgi:uncharacterized metal-binding protein YceD (DUF177 family)